MFTGIIKYNGIIIDINPYDKGLTISIFSEIEEIINIGDSICVNGICLTVVEIIKEYTFVFNIMNETILKTTVKEWLKQQEVNIEISAKSNIIQLDGHIVSGHVDCIGEVINIQENVFFISCPNELIPLLIDKGSITVDGTSLTISTCYDNIFTVSIIPLTLKWTIFRNYKIGTLVNLEGDCRLKQSNQFYGDIYTMFGKYILSDKHAMSIALKLSENALNSAPPNPHVGCIIVKNKKIIGMGFHHSPGKPHAEIEAFNSCKEDVEGSELYVTLEPCCHIGRTGKCVDAIIKNKIKRVIVGVCDTDERVNKKGIQILREAGITVDILNDENVIKSLTPYLYQRKYNFPYIYLKMATTINNKYYDDNIKWITCEESRLDSHKKLRTRVQCIITTSKTVLKDYPKLNIRCEGKDYKNPLIAVLDRFNNIKEEDIQKCGWKERGQEYIIWKGEYIDLLYHIYKKYNVISVLFECGGTLFNSVIKDNIYNEIYLYMAPTIFENKNEYIRGFNDLCIDIKTNDTIYTKKQLGEITDCKQIGSDVRIILKNKSFLELKLETFQTKVKKALTLIKTITNENSCISYNGGKDSNIILHLLYTLGIVIPAFRFCKDIEFDEVNEFADSQYLKFFYKKIIDIKGGFKEGLEECVNKYNMKTIFMGCRDVDFKENDKHQNIEITDEGWPSIIRVYPILDWSHEEVWLYHKIYNLEYCSLYDKGYTSLGDKTKTIKNKELLQKDGTYMKAKDVKFDIKERNSRN